MFYRTIRLTLLLAMSFVLFSTVTAEPSEAQAEDDILGVWQTSGYGLISDLQADEMTIYQVTSVSCVPLAVSDEIDFEDDYYLAEDVFYILDTYDIEFELMDDLLYFDDGSLNMKVADRIEAVPPVCDDGIQESENPEDVFEVFWHTFNEHYAFFELRGVDWQAAYDEFRPQVAADTSDEDLFDVFVEMLEPFEDGHITLESDFDDYSPGLVPEWVDEENDYAAVQDMFDLTIEYMSTIPQIRAGQNIIYAQLNDTAGYINILSMEGYSEDDTDEEVIREAMDEIMTEFAELNAIVVDVRFNGGGYDTNSMLLASYFADTERVVLQKNVLQIGASVEVVHEEIITPSLENIFEGDIYVLTSGLTASGAETFTIAMRNFPNVTIVGEPTNGILSDIHFVRLPNDWYVGLSNERYLSPDGLSFEGVGVPPDVEIMMSIEAVDAGQDPVLDYILESVQ